MNLKEACEKLKIDYDMILNRFGGNEPIYIRFLNKFLADTTYSELEKSWNEINYEGIEKNAHTLKGVAGNLGLENLYTISNEVVQRVRNGEHEGLDKIYQQLQNEYKLITETINKINV